VVTSGYGQVTNGYWPAVVIGTVELLILIMYTTAAVRCEVRRRRDASTLLSVLRPPDELAGEAGDPPPRCWALITQSRMESSMRSQAFQQAHGRPPLRGKDFGQ